MMTVQVHIPDDLAGKVFQLTNNAESFIIDLLRSRVQELNLADEYQMASRENSSLQQSFKEVDLELWEDEY